MAIAQEKVDMSVLKDTFLECPVCVEHFNQTDRRPHLLITCLHAFCTQCLQQLLEKEGKGQITCPLCRQIHNVPGKANSLPVDPVRAKLVDLVQMKNEGIVPCADCPDGNTAEFRCQECSLYLCKQCTYVHKRHQLTCDHQIICLSDALQQPLNMLGNRHCCTHHPKHQLEFFCATDDTLCCMSCTVLEHKGHEFQKLEDVAKKRKEELGSLMQAVHRNAQQLRQRRMREEKGQKAIVQAQKKVRSDINTYFDNMTSILSQRKARLKKDVNQRSEAKLALSRKEVEAIDNTLAVMDSAETYFTQARDKADVVELLQMYPAIKRSLEASADGQGQGQPKAIESAVTFSASNGNLVEKLLAEVGYVTESTDTQKERKLLLCFDEVSKAALKYISKNELIKHLQEKTFTTEQEKCVSSPGQEKNTFHKHMNRRGCRHDPSAADQDSLSGHFTNSRASANLVKKGADELLSYSFELPGGIKVKVCYGNIVKCKLEGIVSAANGELKNFSGVAGAIERACGIELRRECDRHIRLHGPLQVSDVMHTSPGDLIGPRYILHTAAPVHVPTMDDKCAYQLTCTFLRCLHYSHEKLFINSIVFPFISAGVFGVPIDICVQSFLDAVLLFSCAHKTYSTLKEIHLMDTDMEKVQTAIVMLQQHLERDFSELQAAAIYRLLNKGKTT